MKIIVPTNDRVTIAAHTGRCNEFALYEVKNGITISEIFITNPHEHHDEGCCANHSGEHHHGHEELILLFSKADLLYYYSIGKRLRAELDEHEISYKKAPTVNLQGIINGAL